MLVAALVLGAALAADTAYFQQRVHYRIEARLDEANEVLNGRLRLRYHNRSPARLDTLWFHLHLNAFRPNSKWALRELQDGEQWSHTTHTLDYRIGEVTTSQAGGGRWQTSVEVIRDGEIFMPVELAVDGVTQRLESRDRRQVVTVMSSARPAEARLDPQRSLLDIDSGNNRKRIRQ